MFLWFLSCCDNTHGLYMCVCVCVRPFLSFTDDQYAVQDICVCLVFVAIVGHSANHHFHGLQGKPSKFRL